MSRCDSAAIAPKTRLDFPEPGHAREHGEPALGHVERDVPQVVDPGAAHADGVVAVGDVHAVLLLPSSPRGRAGPRPAAASARSRDPASARSGSHSTNVLPTPSSLKSATRPSCASTTCRAMARPSPWPPVRPFDSGGRPNRSKTHPRSSSAIPGPSSRTASQAHPLRDPEATVTSLPPGARRTAFDRRLPMARDRAWASAMTTGPGSRRRVSRRPRSVARTRASSTVCRASSDRSTCWSTNAPERERAVARRSSRRRVIRPVARWTTAAACARSSAVTSSRASTASTLDCTTATGLRSSCETSSTRSRCAVNAASMRSSIPLIVPVRVRSSSSGPVSGMRRDRSVAEISRALAVIAPTGRRARPATHQPMTRLSTNRAASPMTE